MSRGSPQGRSREAIVSVEGYGSLAASLQGFGRMSTVTRISLPATLGVVALLAAPGLLVAQGNPVGPEFRVNSYTTDVQFFPSVAYDSAGNFVVGWESYTQDGSDFGIFAQRYASTGAPLGGEFRVNTFTTSSQRAPAVASD